MEKVAIFDIDGTLIKDCSSERMFFRYLLEEKIITYWDLFRYVRVFLGKLFTFKGIYVRRNKFYIKGKRYDLIVDKARKCFNERIAKYISKDGVNEIKRLKESGYKIILLTGTLDPLMECFKVFCNADEGIGTSLKIVDGLITGEIDGIYAYHTGKAKIVKDLAGKNSIDLFNSYAFANEIIDVNFMKLVGNPVAVNPDQSLKNFAINKNWKIMEFKSGQ